MPFLTPQLPAKPRFSFRNFLLNFQPAGFGTFSDASCICVVGSVSAFHIFSHFRWASCSLCELHLRERILHRIVEFRSPLRGALWQPAVQPHFVLAVRRGAAAEFRKACFRLSAECVRRDWKCVYRAELMKYPLSLYKSVFAKYQNKPIDIAANCCKLQKLPKLPEIARNCLKLPGKN